jgi:hypothetical protein
MESPIRSVEKRWTGNGQTLPITGFWFPCKIILIFCAVLDLLPILEAADLFLNPLWVAELTAYDKFTLLMKILVSIFSFKKFN